MFERIDNLKEAIKWLCTASFRGFSHLEKHYDKDGWVTHLEPVPQWYWSRRLPDRTWLYNRDASLGIWSRRAWRLRRRSGCDFFQKHKTMNAIPSAAIPRAHMDARDIAARARHAKDAVEARDGGEARYAVACQGISTVANAAINIRDTAVAAAAQRAIAAELGMMSFFTRAEEATRNSASHAQTVAFARDRIPVPPLP